MSSTPFKVRHGIIVETSANNVTPIVSNNQVLSGSATNSLVDLSTTWNTTGNPTAIKLNVINTASGSNSSLMDLQTNSSSRFYVAGNGNIGIGNTTPTNKLRVEGTTSIVGNTTITGFANVSSDGQFSGNVGIGTPSAVSAGLYLVKNWTSDASLYGQYNYTSDTNTAITVARSKYITYSILNNFNQNKSSDGLTTYNSGYYGQLIGVYNGNTTSGGDAYASILSGSQISAANYANGATSNSVATMRGVFTQSAQYGTGTITQAEGVRARITIGNSSITGNISSAYSVFSEIIPNSIATITTGYLYYGQYTAGNVTSKYGIGLVGDSYNYFQGNVAISASNTSPNHKLRVDGNVSIVGAVSDITTLASGNTTITGFVNASVSVNTSQYTIGATLIANTLGVYHTGTINAASFTTTGTTSNTSGIYPASNTSGTALGSSTQRWTINANTIDATGNFTSTANVTANNANTTNDLNVGRNLTVAGNLTVTGNVTVIGANNLSIVDNFIYLNSNNTTQNIDLGFAGNYNDGTYKHTGFFRDATDGYWKVFDGYMPEPDANVNIDTSNSTFNVAGFWSNNIRLGNNTVYGTINSTSYSGAANSSTYANSSITNTFTVGTASYFIANGNLGIGNTAPAHKLRVEGTTSITGSTVIETTDNTNAALRITQLGTGEAIRVEDSANPDATPFIIDASGRVVSGHNSAISIAGASYLSHFLGTGVLYPLAAGYAGNSATGPHLSLVKNRSADWTTQTIVQNGDEIGAIEYSASDGTNFLRAALIAAYIDNTPGANDMPGRLVFATTADGASGLTERMRIDSAGNVGIGNTSPTDKLSVNGTVRISGSSVIEVTDNTNAALRITQLGNGDAIRVEDSTNPDSTPFVVANNGVVLIGNGTDQGSGVFQIGGGQTSNAANYVQHYSYANGSRYTLSRANAGTTIVANNDTVGDISFAGYDGSAYIRLAEIRADVDGTPGSNDMPGRLVFRTTSDGSSALSERMRIDANGNIGIGTSSINSNLKLDVVGNFGIAHRSSSDVNANSTSRMFAGAYTGNLATVYAFSSTSNNNGLGIGGGTTLGEPATTIGFFTGTVGSTGTGTERMRIDASGNVGIGTTSPSYKLQVNGSFAATTKSFVIDHPTKPEMKLRYGSLEGPENGVYIRGKLEESSIIELPDYWWNLVDPESITVNLTPYGSKQDLWVQSTSAYKINLNQPANCFFTVYAERKDVEKLIVEF